MKKIKLHLGPPKTGTTTIQNVLKNLQSDNYINGDLELSEMILSFSQGDLQTELNIIQDKIQNLLLNHDLLIYSDERVLLEYSSKNDWTKQLKKVFQVFQLPKVQVEVIIFVRNPTQLIPSLYQQMRNINWVSKIPLEEFVLTNQVKIFNYNFLEKVILETGFTNITYQQFEILLEKELDLGIFGLNNYIPLDEVKNKSRVDKENRIYVYTAADIIRRNVGVLKFLVPVRLRKVIAKSLHFKIREEKISRTPLIPNDFLEAYKDKSSP